MSTSQNQKQNNSFASYLGQILRAVDLSRKKHKSNIHYSYKSSQVLWLNHAENC